jgi:uncharacterized protein (DUF58 family)
MSVGSAKTMWYAWVDKRSRSALSHKLHHKNLYILPTATGWAFLFLALIIWLLGTNYQNNLILALAYMQLSLLVVVILHTYNNLSGLTVECLGSDGGQVGENIEFKFRICSANRFGSHSVFLAWAGNEPITQDILGTDPHLMTVSAVAVKRGRFQPKRLRVRSDFPMGLFKCWTWLRFPAEAIVYPLPMACKLPLSSGQGGNDTGKNQISSGGDEFWGYQQYHPGDSLRQIAWKQYARERGLHTKIYGSQVAQCDELSWQSFFDGNLERTLSYMTFWALTLHTQNRSFSVQLPSSNIPTGDGDAHLSQVLNALALHESSSA